MKTELTKEQSQHLIDLGVPKEKASKIINAYVPAGGTKLKSVTYYIFTLTDLLKILPKEIEGKYGLVPLVITYGGICKGDEVDRWFAYYDDVLETIEINTDELIDALYELTVWCIENGHLKFD